MKKLIELWKDNCEHCEAVRPIVEELEKEGIVFEKYNIETPEGEKMWQAYTTEIDVNNKKMGYEQGYIYTPTFINPKTKKVIAFTDRAPAKEELITLAEN